MLPSTSQIARKCWKSTSAFIISGNSGASEELTIEEAAQVKLFASITVCLCLGGTSFLCAQTLQVTPSVALSDQTVTIRADGLRPNQLVTIQAGLVDGEGHRWSSQSEFLADAHGTIELSQQAPVRGSYKNISPMGPIWSMKPDEKNVQRYISPHELAPQIIDFQLTAEGTKVATAQFEQRTIAKDVRQVKVEGKLHGILFVPGTAGAHPGVLVVGGSEGGLPIAKAAWLASHGFAAFALAYFRYEDLPPDLSGIPLEYFGQALAWMRQQPEILADHIAVVGTSRGGELALQLASMYPQIRAVVAYVPANVRYPACCGSTRFRFAWTWQGLPLAYYSPPRRGLQNQARATEPAIAVEHIHGPVLLISGDDDGVWPSSLMAKAIVGRLKSAHFPFPVQHLNYPHAGHLAGRPEIVPAWHGSLMQFVSGARMSFGGTPTGDADSSLDAIPKVLDFLRKSLQATGQAQP
jgi:dienelactone hydrolase